MQNTKAAAASTMPQTLCAGDAGGHDASPRNHEITKERNDSEGNSSCVRAVVAYLHSNRMGNDNADRQGQRRVGTGRLYRRVERLPATAERGERRSLRRIDRADDGRAVRDE